MEVFITEAKHKAAQEPYRDRYSELAGAGRRTVLDDLFESDLPPEELSVDRLQNETMGLLAAGIQTTKTALAIASFHILNDPAIYLRLREELYKEIPDPLKIPSVVELEKLPYLSSCVEEGNCFNPPFVAIA